MKTLLVAKAASTGRIEVDDCTIEISASLLFVNTKDWD